MYPTVPNPVDLFPFFSVRDLSEYTSRCSCWSSNSVMSSMCGFAHSSFTEVPAMLSRVNIFTLSKRSSSDGCHSGSAFGMMHSVSSVILLLMWVMHMENFILGLSLYLFKSSNGGSGGGDGAG